MPSGVICGVTSRLRLAFLNDTDVAPLDVACWYGISSPCSMRALIWSAVITRGLETMLPLPSASSADSSRFRKRLAVAPNSESAKVAADAPPNDVVLAGKLTNCESGM